MSMGRRRRTAPPATARLVILARWPAPGRCKRRLAVELGTQRAATVQSRLTRHSVAAARRVCGGERQLLLAASGIGAAAAERWGHALGVDAVVMQGPGSLGARLGRLIASAGREGIARLVLIGSDLPELAAADLEAAFAALEAGAPLVLGPAVDGGYWLLGLAGRPLPRAPRLVAGASGAIDWGSDQVLRQTLGAAAREGLPVLLLPERADLDRPADLRRWR